MQRKQNGAWAWLRRAFALAMAFAFTVMTVNPALAYNLSLQTGLEKAGTSDYRIDYSKLVWNNADINWYPHEDTTQMHNVIHFGEMAPGILVTDNGIGYHAVVDESDGFAHIFWRDSEQKKSRSVGDKIKPDDLVLTFPDAVISPTGEVGDLMVALAYDNVELMQSRGNSATTVSADKNTWYHAISVPTRTNTKGLHLWSALCAPVTNNDGKTMLANQTSTINIHGENPYKGDWGTTFNALIGMAYNDIPSTSTKVNVTVNFLAKNGQPLAGAGSDDFVLFFNDIDQDDESKATAGNGYADNSYAESIFPVSGFKKPTAFVAADTKLKLTGGGQGISAQDNADDSGGEAVTRKAATFLTGNSFQLIWKGNICGTYLLQKTDVSVGSLVVEKQATGDAIKDLSYHFKVTITGTSPKTLEFNLKDGQKRTIANIPLGSTAVVKETSTGIYKTTYSPKGADTDGVKIEKKDTTVKVTVNNTQNNGTLMVTKDLAQ